MNFAKTTACAFLALVAIASFAAKPVDRGKLNSLKETLLKKGKPFQIKYAGGIDMGEYMDDDENSERTVFLLDSLVKAQRNNPLKNRGVNI